MKEQLEDLEASEGSSERSKRSFDAAKQAVLSGDFEEMDAKRILLHLDPDEQPDLRQHLLMLLR